MSDRAPHLLDITVPDSWIDYNGHMNMAYYLVAFDKATDVLFERLGIGPTYLRLAAHSMFALESHLTYSQEAKLGDRLAIGGRLVDADDKKLHFFLRMTMAATGQQLATLEMLVLHVAMAGPKAAPFPPARKAAIDAMLAEHRVLPTPPEIGRKVGIRRK